MVTITDVAREAGVSKTTVSYVISRPSRVSEESRAKVRKAMEKLGYTVNHAARALSTSKTMTLGLLAPMRDDAPISVSRGVYLCALSNFARHQGYDLLLLSEPDGVRALESIVDAHKVDGLIVMDVDCRDPRVPKAAASGVPSVLLGIPDDSLGIDEVDTDFERAANVLVQHFAERGHTDIALVHAVEQPTNGGANFAVRFRKTAFAQAARLGVTMHVLEETLVENQNPSDAPREDTDPADLIRRTLAAFPQVTGLIIDDDNAALSATQVFLEMGITVPDDLSVAVVVPDALHSRMRIPYTAVDINLQSVAEETIETLVRRIEDPGRPAVTHLVSQPLEDRGSVKNLTK